MLGLCGAERTGKSTLARAYAEKHGMVYMPSRVSEVFRSMNLPVGELPPTDRLAVQEKILETWCEDVAKITGPAISDRTPLDMIAYTILDLQSTGTDAKLVRSYVERCIAATNRYCSMIVLIQPGIPFVAEEGKWPPCEAHQMGMSAVIRGVMMTPTLRPLTFTMRSSVLDLEARIETLHRARVALLAAVDEERAGAALH